MRQQPDNQLLPTAIVGTRARATAYGMFAGTLVVGGLVITMLLAVVDHAIKSPEPLSSLFRADRAALAAQVAQQQRTIDSLQHLARQVPLLRTQVEQLQQRPISTTNRPMPAELGQHYTNEALRQRDYNAYLVAKLRFYYTKSQALEAWMKE